MTLKRKLVLVICIIPILLGACLAGIILYYYHHPSRIKELVERSVSASTGMLCVVENLSYSLKPMALEARGIRLEPGKGQRGFLLEIPDLTAEVSLTGRFGEKSLVLKALEISGFSARVSGDMALPKAEQKAAPPSFFTRAVRRLSAFFLFKEFKIETAQVNNGTLLFESVDQTIQVERVRAKLAPGRPVDISCTAQAVWPVKKMRFSAPRIHLETDQAISLVSPKLGGILKVEEAQFESPHADVAAITAAATCMYEHDRKAVSFHSVDIRLKGIQTKQGFGKGIIPEDVHLTSDGLFDLSENRVDVPRLSLAGEDLLYLTGSLKAGFGPQGAIEFQGDVDSSLLKNLKLSLDLGQEKADIRLQGQNMDLIQSLASLKWLPPGWTFEGLESMEVNASMNKDQQWDVIGQLDLKGVSFESPDAVHMGEGITATVKAHAVIDLRDSQVMAKTSIGVGEGELLCDKFYADLRRNGFLGSCEGLYDLVKKSLQVSHLKLGLKDVLTVEGAGTLVLGRAPRADLSIRVRETPLKPIFHVFVLEPFKAENPFLGSLNMGGAISAAVNLNGTQTDWTARGHCHWVDGTFSSEDGGFSFQGIALDLPMWLQSGKHGEGESMEKGALSIRSTTLPMLPEQAVRVSLDALPNQLAISSPTHLKIPGGELLVGRVAGRDIHSSKRSIETSLTIEEIQLEPLLSHIWPQPIKGTVKGKLAPILLQGGSVQTMGEIYVSAFDGEIRLSDFRVSGIFDPGPVVKFDAGWDNMSLAMLTSGTGFGKIEGVLRGHAKGCEIAYGQPQAFDLLLEPVKREGVPQKISVKAVENISQIGGGQSPFMGVAGAFASIFKEFPYKKIGIRASLANDVFKINGTIKEGGTEYLIKRGGISGVNVVNQNPDNRVSFKDMVKRIKRVTADGGGPVVK